MPGLPAGLNDKTTEGRKDGHRSTSEHNTNGQRIAWPMPDLVEGSSANETERFVEWCDKRKGSKVMSLWKLYYCIINMSHLGTLWSGSLDGIKARKHLSCETSIVSCSEQICMLSQCIMHENVWRGTCMLSQCIIHENVWHATQGKLHAFAMHYTIDKSYG